MSAATHRQRHFGNGGIRNQSKCTAGMLEDQVTECFKLTPSVIAAELKVFLYGYEISDR